MYNLLHRHFHLRYHGVYRHAKKLFVFDLALLGLATVMFSASLFFFFWKPGITELIDLNISLGTDRIKSGEEIKLTINYTNNSKIKLAKVILSAHLPAGFIIDKTRTPESIFTSESIFTQPIEILPGAKGQKEIYGWFWAEANKEEKITANLTYQPEETNLREQKLSHLLAKFSESVLQGKLAISSSTFPNQTLKFVYSLTNNSTNEIKEINLTDNLSNKIIPNNLKKFSLQPKATKTINGEFIPTQQSGKLKILVTPRILINNQVITQQPSEQEITIISPNIISSASFPVGTSFADGGQIIPVELSWQNKSNFQVNNLRLKLKANYPQAVNWYLTALNNNAKVEQNTLVIDSSSRTKLSDGKPNSGDQFKINLYLNNNFNLGQNEKVYLELTPVIEASLNSVNSQKFSQEGSKDRLPLVTQINFYNEARYYTSSGDQLGRGPLPPVVGQTTKYWVFAQINNTSNPLKDAFFKTSLPNGIELTGKDSVTIGQPIKYNSNDRSITWNYYNLPANSHTGIYFEVAVTPTASQVGQKLQLTNELYFSATDEFTSKKFNFKQSGVNNILQKNDKGSEKGYLISL